MVTSKILTSEASNSLNYCSSVKRILQSRKMYTGLEVDNVCERLLLWKTSSQRGSTKYWMLVFFVLEKVKVHPPLLEIRTVKEQKFQSGSGAKRGSRPLVYFRKVTFFFLVKNVSPQFFIYLFFLSDHTDLTLEFFGQNLQNSPSFEVIYFSTVGFYIFIKKNTRILYNIQHK